MGSLIKRRRRLRDEFFICCVSLTCGVWRFILMIICQCPGAFAIVSLLMIVAVSLFRTVRPAAATPQRMNWYSDGKYTRHENKGMPNVTDKSALDRIKGNSKSRFQSTDV